MILDVVYNHTAEGNHLGPDAVVPRHRQRRLLQAGRRPALLFRHHRVRQHAERRQSARAAAGHGFAALLGAGVRHRRLPLRSCHDAGARFARLRSDSTFLAALRQDPVLSRVKLIAEAWDLGEDGYQVGNFPPGWAEWNGRYRDDVRAFWRGDDGYLPAIADGLLGSARPVRQGRPPAVDQRQLRHRARRLHARRPLRLQRQAQRGERGRQQRRPRRQPQLELRRRGADRRSGHPRFARPHAPQRDGDALLSQGTPMLLMGDEQGRTQQGNNNAYCQDNEISWMQWQDLGPRDEAFREFTTGLLKVRRVAAAAQPEPLPARRDVAGVRRRHVAARRRAGDVAGRLAQRHQQERVPDAARAARQAAADVLQRLPRGRFVQGAAFADRRVAAHRRYRARHHRAARRRRHRGSAISSSRARAAALRGRRAGDVVRVCDVVGRDGRSTAARAFRLWAPGEDAWRSLRPTAELASHAACGRWLVRAGNRRRRRSAAAMRSRSAA